MYLEGMIFLFANFKALSLISKFEKEIGGFFSSYSFVALLPWEDEGACEGGFFFRAMKQGINVERREKWTKKM